MPSLSFPSKTATTDAQKEEIIFGHPMLEHFGFAKTFVNLNNGSFGATPLPVLKYCEDINRQAEERPDTFFRASYKPVLNTARERIAKIIHAETDECVIVPNASHGINTVLHNFVWKKEDILIGFSTTYFAINQTLRHISDREPHPTCSIIPLAFPTTHAEILTLFRNHIQSLPRSDGQKIFAVIDTIVSNPGVTMPWEKLVEICREENVWSLIDAAHGIGVLNVDLNKTQPDFWVSNAHKWLMSKRGSAILYVPRRHHHLIRTSFPTSWGYVSPPASNTLAGLFEFTGTLDMAPFLSINAAIDFRQSIGGEQKIQDYCNALALKGGQRLAEVLGTEVMGNTEELANHMINVCLPLKKECSGSWEDDYPTAIAIMEDLMVKHDCFAAIYPHNGKWWVRASAQIWNDVSDFECLGQVLKQICAERNDAVQ
ncbi:hypothetical protein FRB99_006517 [Tulasnella sp. 403]|nr:hypothetical protein FRB99_006517 [Tulasnella sp. 403]